MLEQEEIRPLHQFRHVRRYWDTNRGINIAKIGPGEVYVSRHHELISTLLGSCIAVCMRDRVNKIGGMNHFKLPQPKGGRPISSEDANYGNYAMELLINAILKNGGEKQNLECKVYGGGNVLQNVSSTVGAQNIEFVFNYLQAEGIPVKRNTTGGDRPQQVYYHPITGSAFSIMQGQNSAAEIKCAEQAYLGHIEETLEKDDVTFF